MQKLQQERLVVSIAAVEAAQKSTEGLLGVCLWEPIVFRTIEKILHWSYLYFAL